MFRIPGTLANFFSWTSLLNHLVLTRARHPRSLASSRLTATFWSPSSPSASHSRCFVRDLSSGLLLNSILWLFWTTWLLVATATLLCHTLLRRARWTWVNAKKLPQLCLLTMMKLFGILLHGVILNPRLCLFAPRADRNTRNYMILLSHVAALPVSVTLSCMWERSVSVALTWL